MFLAIQHSLLILCSKDLMDSSWKIRNGALDQLNAILVSNKRIKSNLGKLFHFIV